LSIRFPEKPDSFIGEAKIQKKFNTYRGLPFLSISSTPKDWGGDLLILSGYGLGDTVVSLGLQRYFSGLYPKARVCLVAHPSWRGLSVGTPYPVCFYDVFLGLTENQKLPAPPFPNIKKKLQKFFLSSPDSCIGFADIESPERFAQGERFTETVCRMVGMGDLSSVRPFIPISESDWRQANIFLQQNGLFPNSYVLLAVEASSNEREWGTENFLFVAEKIYQNSGLKSILVHEREIPECSNYSSTISSRGLRLSVICALIAMSKGFIGNDSGPSHIAAAFDIPLLSIYLERDKIPFEIRPLSPLATQVILFDGPEKDDRETVLCSAIAFINDKKILQNPECFACGRPMRHILLASETDILWKCFCGALWKSGKNQKSTNVDLVFDQQGLVLGQKSLSLPSYYSEINLFKKTIEYCFKNNLLINVTYENNTFTVTDTKCFLDKDIVWSIDSIIFFFKEQGYFISRVESLKKENSFIVFLSIQETQSWIAIPWGGRSLRVFGSSLYCKYFAWTSWASSKKLIDLMKSDWEPAKWKDFFWVGFSIFLYSPNVKNFFRWQRLFLKLFIKEKI